MIGGHVMREEGKSACSLPFILVLDDASCFSPGILQLLDSALSWSTWATETKCHGLGGF